MHMSCEYHGLVYLLPLRYIHAVNIHQMHVYTQCNYVRRHFNRIERLITATNPVSTSLLNRLFRSPS